MGNRLSFSLEVMKLIWGTMHLELNRPLDRLIILFHNFFIKSTKLWQIMISKKPENFNLSTQICLKFSLKMVIIFQEKTKTSLFLSVHFYHFIFINFHFINSFLSINRGVFMILILWVLSDNEMFIY